MNIKRIGIDLAKQVFQLHGVDRFDKTSERMKLSRLQMHSYFKVLPPTLICMEACGSSHYWGRVLSAYGQTHCATICKALRKKWQERRNSISRCDASCNTASVARANVGWC